MILFSRPTADLLVPSGFNGGYADLADESDATKIYWDNATTFSSYRLQLASPPNANGLRVTTAYLRLRMSKTNAGTPVSTANQQISCRVQFFEGTTQRWDSGVFVAPANTGVWTDVSGTMDLSAVTDWSDLRVLITPSQTGGGGATRGLGITRCEFEYDWQGMYDDFMITGLGA